MRTLASIAALALALASAAAAPADLKIEHGWARATPKGAEVGAGYFTIENNAATADRLASVTADFATVQVHEMKKLNGVMQMREVAGGLPVPPHATLALSPGGYHLMFTALKHPLVKGETVKIMLTFDHAGAVSVDLPVLGIGAPGPAGMGGMGGMKM